MDGRDEKLDKVRKLFQDATGTDHQSTNITVTGNGNITAAGSINFNQRNVIRPRFTPGPQHITSSQAAAIKRRVDELVSRDVDAGKNQQHSYASWWRRLKDHFGVTTYKEIPAHLYDQATLWLQTQKNITRPQIRRTNNARWKNELYAKINAKSRQLGMSKADVYNIAFEKFGKKITSLKQLGEKNLERLAEIIMRRKAIQ